MTLVQVAFAVANELGRPELVTNFATADYTPTAMLLRLINAAQDRLDSLIDHPAEELRANVAVVQGDYLVTVPSNFQHIERIDLETTTERLTLEKRTEEWMRLNYAEPFADVEEGEPADWCRYTPTTAITNARQLLLLPPADGSYTLCITGRKYLTEFASNSDTTWWSVAKPHVLVKMVKRTIAYEANRNSQEVADWDAEIRDDLFEIERQQGVEDMAGPRASRYMGWGPDA
jgi:hypothetical protein